VAEETPAKRAMSAIWVRLGTGLPEFICGIISRITRPIYFKVVPHWMHKKTTPDRQIWGGVN
jgi:hypothetical protein